MVALEMREECISTSLSFASKGKAEQRTHKQPHLNRDWGLRSFLGHAFLSACPLLPCCQEGETVWRKGSRKRDHKVTELCLHAQTKNMKSTWNLHESRLRLARRQNHGVDSPHKGELKIKCHQADISFDCGIGHCK